MLTVVHKGWSGFPLPLSASSRDNPVMDEIEVKRWFDSYLADFVALGRGEIDDVWRVFPHYGVPLLLSTDAGCTVLTDETQVLAVVQQQVDGMRSAGYDRSDELAAETTVLNHSCATYRARFARLRADGSEIAQLEATYLITDRPAGCRITAIIVHSAP